MKTNWSGTLEGYCTRRQRLAKAEKLLIEKAVKTEVMTDRLEMQDIIHDVEDYNRASTLALVENAQSLRYLQDQTTIQTIELSLRKQLTALRYFFKPASLESRLKKKQTLEASAILDKEIIGFKRRSIDHRNNIATAETSENEIHKGKLGRKSRKIEITRQKMDDALAYRFALEDIRRHFARNEG